MTISLGNAMTAAQAIDLTRLVNLTTSGFEGFGGSFHPVLTPEEKDEIEKAIRLIERLREPHPNHPTRRGWNLPHENEQGT